MLGNFGSIPPTIPLRFPSSPKGWVVLIKKSEAQRIATSVTLQCGYCRVNLGVVLFLDNSVGAVEEGDDTTTKPVFLGALQITWVS